MSSIFILSCRTYDRDGYGYFAVEDWSLEHGYFTSQEDVEAYIDKLEDVEGKYETYVQRAEEYNSQAQAKYDAQVKAWDLLDAAGVDKPFFKPTRVITKSVQTFEEWRKNYRSEWSYEEVQPHA